MSYKIKPIKAEKDYDEALRRVEYLMNHSDQKDLLNELEVISILIEQYENQKYPVALPNPVDAIKFYMAQNDLTQADLIPYIGSRSRVSEVLSGKRELNLKMIRSLHKNLGIPVNVLISETLPTLPKEFEHIDFDQFPIAEMIKKGAFNVLEGAECTMRNAEELISGLFGVGGGAGVLKSCRCRKNDHLRINAKLNTYALTGWCLHVLAEASKVKLESKYEKGCLTNDLFMKNLVSLSCFENGPFLVKEFLAKHGIILEIVDHYKNTYLDGAAFILQNGTPVVGLTLRYDRTDNFWFALMHELGHIALHLSDSNCYFADDMTLRKEDDCKEEKEADAFAEKALLPEQFALDENKFLSGSAVIQYSRRHNISPAIVAGRIQYRTRNYRRFANLVGRGAVKKCFQ
jgi:HTH-type transcriptional regulator / antitoxin HigA